MPSEEKISDSLKEQLQALQDRVFRLETRLAAKIENDLLIHKAFKSIGLHANYAEFGVYRGTSMIHAGYAAWRVLDEFDKSDFGSDSGTHAVKLASLEKDFERMRFFAFDSFAGIPPLGEVDRDREVFREGTYVCSEDAFRANLEAHKFPMNKLVTVPGFFEETCSEETAQRIGLERLGVVLIDSDLYGSAKTALEFVTPYLCDPAIVIFDDWFQFQGHPGYGEQRAFREWREAYPEFTVTEFHKQGTWRNSFVLSR